MIEWIKNLWQVARVRLIVQCISSRQTLMNRKGERKCHGISNFFPLSYKKICKALIIYFFNVRLRGSDIFSMHQASRFRESRHGIIKSTCVKVCCWRVANSTCCSEVSGWVKVVVSAGAGVEGSCSSSPPGSGTSWSVVARSPSLSPPSVCNA